MRVECDLDQRLGIGPWVERASIDEKAPPVELAYAGDARDGLAGRAAAHQSFEPYRCLRLKPLIRARDEALVRERRGMTYEQPRIELRRLDPSLR